MGKLQTNFIYNAILTGSNVIIPLITFPYITRKLGPDSYGLISFVNSFVQYFIVLSTLGIPIYGIREIAKVRDNYLERSKVFSEILTINIFLLGIVTIFYLSIIFFIPVFRVNITYYLLGLSLLLTFPFGVYWFFSGMGNFKFITIRTVILQVLQVILIYSFVKSKQDSIIYFSIFIIISVLNSIINYYYASSYITFKFCRNIQFLRKHMQPLIYLFLFSFAASMYEILDSVLLGLISHNESVGLYTVANRIVKLPITFINILATVLIPQIAYTVGQNDVKEMSRLVNNSIIFVITLAIPMSFGVYILAPEIISVFNGNAFQQSVLTLRIMVPLIIILGISTIFGLQILNPLSKDKLLTKAVVIGMFFNLIFSFLCMSIWKYNGAALLAVLTELLTAIIAYIYARRFLPFSLNWKQICITILISIIFVLIVYIIRLFTYSDLLTLIISIICCSIYYFIIQYYLKNEIIIGAKNYILNLIRVGNDKKS